MPELPEVETVRRGLEPLIVNQVIKSVVCRVPQLRWPLSPDLNRQLSGQTIQAVERRAKYLLLKLAQGTLIIHLGMTGVLRVVDSDIEPVKHDHFDLVFTNGNCLRLNDCRRFGAVVYSEDNIDKHPLLKELGPEPLTDSFNAGYIYQRSRNCKGSVKNFLMNQKIVVGVGNIYASEVLFKSRINPVLAANKVSRSRYEVLVGEIKTVLQEAIDQGGTTIRDFRNTDGQPGYFKQQLMVYGRNGETCKICADEIKKIKLGGRSTFYCPDCQR